MSYKAKPEARILEANPYVGAAKKSARDYRRARHLPTLLALWPGELADTSVKGTQKIIARLEAALRAERRRGRAGDWAYDLNRHQALISALEAERLHLERLT